MSNCAIHGGRIRPAPPSSNVHGCVPTLVTKILMRAISTGRVWPVSEGSTTRANLHLLQ